MIDNKGNYLGYINSELKRQQDTIGLIASENFVSQDVLLALGSVFTNKYAEGYPAKRYYAGNQIVDEVEEWTKELGLRVFNLDRKKWHINVQPYSGSPANMAIYLGLLEPGDKIMSLSLSHGGHLTHGHKVSFSGRLFNFVHYSVGEDGWLDYDKIEKFVVEEKPKMIVTGATAYPRRIDFSRFSSMAKKVNSLLMADISHIAGLIAAGLHPDCFNCADVVMTTTHKTLRGPRGAVIYCRQELAENIDKAVFPGLQGGPHINVILAKGVAFQEALQSDFIQYQKQVLANANIMAEELTKSGIKLISGGTDNHLLLLDLSESDLGAKEFEHKLEEIGIIVNKNTIPYDRRSPFNPSGIRIGTPGITTRGMKENEVISIAQIITQVVKNIDNNSFEWIKVKQRVQDLVVKFPIYN